MNWYKLVELQKIAVARQMIICVWRPTDVQGIEEDMYVWDKCAKKEEFLENKSKHSTQAVIEKDGTIHVFNQNGIDSIILPQPVEKTKSNPQETFELVTGGDRRKNPEKAMYRSMTFDEVKTLHIGSHIWFKANDGTARQIKVNGQIRLWKRDPERIEIPCKYGLYECFTFTKHDLDRLLIRLN